MTPNSFDRPNVILIVSDDHGYADRSALGIDPEVSTPALDRLAQSAAADHVTKTVLSAMRSTS